MRESARCSVTPCSLAKVDMPTATVGMFFAIHALSA